MKLFIATIAAEPRTHTIYRPCGGIDGYRQIRDPAGQPAVTGFALAIAQSLPATPDLWSGRCVIAEHGESHIGQSNRALQCIAEHTEDPTKAFAADAYLLHEQEPHKLEWSRRLYLEQVLIMLARDAGLITLADTVEPRVLPWPVEQSATMERLVTDCRRLLFDGGCGVFAANLACQKVPASDERG